MTPNQQKDLASQIADLKGEVEEIKTSIEGLMTAWEAVTGLLKFIKFLAQLGVAIATLWGFVLTFLHFSHGGGK